MKRLILCAGKVRRPGWMTLDYDPQCKPDFLAAIPPLPFEVRATWWDAIEWVHGIGTFYPWEGEQLLGEIRECLTKDGVLTLEQPNLEEVARGILMREEYVWWMFGDPSLQQSGMMNRWAYSPNSLVALLRKAGFSRIAVMPAQYHGALQRDFRVEAQK
jgi:hypothetical protein